MVELLVVVVVVVGGSLVVVELLLLLVVVVVVAVGDEDGEELLEVEVGLPVSDGDDELPVADGVGVLLAAVPEEDEGSAFTSLPKAPRPLSSWRPTRKAGKRFAWVMATAARTATRWDCGRNNMMAVVDENDGSWITGRTVGLLTRLLVSALQRPRETDVTGCDEKQEDVNKGG